MESTANSNGDVGAPGAEEEAAAAAPPGETAALAQEAPAAQNGAAEPAAATNGAAEEVPLAEAPAAQAAPAEDAEAKKVDDAAAAKAAAAKAAEAQKHKAVEELKAALRKAAQGIKKEPTAKQKANQALLCLCMCVKQLGKDSPVYEEFAKALPKIGDGCLAPLMGTKAAARTDAKAPGLGPHRMMGRVKSYNTKKGFGFVDMPGCPRDIFVYNAHLIGRVGLITGETVTFDLIIDDGRPQARQVRVVGATEAAAAGLGPPGMLAVPGASATAAAARGTEALNAAIAQVAAANAAAAAQHGTANPLTSLKQAMSAESTVLAMAAAAAEVPTTIHSPEEALADKIREAQSAAVKEQRQRAPKAGPSAEQAVRAAQAAKEAKEARAQMEWSAPAQKGGMPVGKAAGKGSPMVGQSKSRFVDEGAIPTNSTVRVTNFPAPDVNDCVGVVQGYDAATGRYSVTVDIHRDTTPATGSVETVPLQLHERYLRVEKYPPGAKGGKGSGPGMPSSGMPAPIVGGVSEAFRKSAAQSLARFNNRTGIPGPMPSMPAGQWLGGAQPTPGPGTPFGAGGGKGVAGGPPGNMGPGAGGKAPGYPGPPGNLFRPPGEAGNSPPPPDPRAAAGFGARPTGPPGNNEFSGGQDGVQAKPPSQSQAPQQKNVVKQPPSSMFQQGMPKPPPVGSGGPGMPGAPADGGKGGRSMISLAESVPGGFGAQPKMPPAPAFAQRQAGGTPLEHFAKMLTPQADGPSQAKAARPAAVPPKPPAPPMHGSSSMPQQAAAPQVHAYSNVPSEGRVGQTWIVLQSPDFVHVIVRETQEVNSPELRRIRPGEVCQQRGPTIALDNGLVRMPVEPEGWVTVHARFIRGGGGPTFLEEVDNPTTMAGQGPPSRAQADGRENRQDLKMPPAEVPKGKGFLGQVGGSAPAQPNKVLAGAPSGGPGDEARMPPPPEQPRQRRSPAKDLPPLAQRARAVQGSDYYGVWSREDLIGFKDSLTRQGELAQNGAGIRVLRLHNFEEEGASRPPRDRDRDRGERGDRDRVRDRDRDRGDGDRDRRRRRAQEEAEQQQPQQTPSS